MFFGNFVVNRKDAAGIITDVIANRPAAGAQPKRTIFVSVDEQKIYINDGGVWVLIGTGAGGGTPDDTTAGYFAMKSAGGHLVNDQIKQADTNPLNPGKLKIGSTAAHTENIGVDVVTNTANGGNDTSKYSVSRDSFEIFVTDGSLFPQTLLSILQLVGGGINKTGYIKAPRVGFVFNYSPSANSFNTYVGDTDALGNGTIMSINDDTSKAYFDNAAHNVFLGIGTNNALGALAFGTAVVADLRKALIMLTNNNMSVGSSNGNYIGANPAAFSGNFFHFEINNIEVFNVDAVGAIRSKKLQLNTSTDALFWDGINARATLSANQLNFQALNAVGIISFAGNAGTTMIYQANGNLSIGVLAGSVARLNSRDTLEQLRLEYDGANYAQHKVDSTGKLTISPTGAAAAFTKPVILPGYTVGTLPAGSIGMMAYVTDALAPTYQGIAVGGGAVKCTVFYNGANWVTG